jgi:hypothetical protein
MSGDSLKAQAALMQLRAGGGRGRIRGLIVSGALDAALTSEEIVRLIAESTGDRIRTLHVHTYMKRFMDAGLVRALKFNGSNINYYVIASVSREAALRQIGKGRRVLELEDELFSDALMGRLGNNFSADLLELKVNSGKCGTSTAFLLRKILEKLLVIVFRKLNKIAAIEDKNRPGGWKGLQQMIEVAAKEKEGGVSILLHKTAAEVGGIKFLGDVAAHNPFVDVDMRTVTPQMPYIITALEELSRHL